METAVEISDSLFAGVCRIARADLSPDCGRRFACGGVSIAEQLPVNRRAVIYCGTLIGDNKLQIKCVDGSRPAEKVIALEGVLKQAWGGPAITSPEGNQTSLTRPLGGQYLATPRDTSLPRRRL